MEIKISAENIELTDAIKGFVEEKMDALPKFMDSLLDADVWVGKTSNHHAKGDIFECKINASYPGGMFRGEATGDDLYNTIMAAKKIVKEQIIKHKEQA